jgi:hypothetical protein
MIDIYRYILLAYFITHIPITLLIDLQSLFLESYPEALKEFVRNHYLLKYGDYLMADPPIWLKALLTFEILQVPYFFVATYALLYRKNWIRISSIVYSSHVITAVSLILAELHFSSRITFEQKVSLFSFYLPYLIIPACLLAYMCAYPQPLSKAAGKKQ